MTKQEIHEWLVSATLVDITNEDDNGCFATRIYKKGNKYYSIEFYDFEPRVNRTKVSSGEYEVAEVVRKTREETYYEKVERGE